jgi:hypothetical protein
VRLYELANWLRAADLRVEEAAGWQSAGHGDLANAPRRIVDVSHHTAGGPNGRAPSLWTCINGVPGVPGPLCNVVQTREPDGNDVFIVIASGVSYNAGTGGYAGVSGNWYTVGTECEHTGTEPFPEHRARLRQRAAAAILTGLGQTNGDRACQHFEWSDAGKPDIGAPRVDANAWRQRITEFMHGTVEPEPVPPEEGTMLEVVQVQGPFGPVARLVTGDGVILEQWAGATGPYGLITAAVEQKPSGCPFRVIRADQPDQAARFVKWSDLATARFEADA